MTVVKYYLTKKNDAPDEAEFSRITNTLCRHMVGYDLLYDTPEAALAAQAMFADEYELNDTIPPYDLIKVTSEVVKG